MMKQIAASPRAHARPATRAAPAHARLSTAVSSQVLHARLLQLAEAERRLAAPRRHVSDRAIERDERDSEVPSSCDTLCIVSWDEEAGGGGGDLWRVHEAADEQ